MPKAFAAFDVDGTIFKSSLLEKVVGEAIGAGVFEAEPFNVVYENRQRWQRDNNEGLYQAYLHRLVGEFINRIEGVSVDEFNRVTLSMIQEQSVRKFAFPRKLIAALHSSHYILAMSGSPEIIVRPFLEDMPFSEIHGSKLESEDGKFTGKAETVGDKGEYIQSLIRNSIVRPVGSIAVGDTYNDVSMLEISDTPIMFNGSKTLTNYGKEFGWTRVNEIKDQITVLGLEASLMQYRERDLNDLMMDLKNRAEVN